jgi:hypothetical protein
MSSVLPIWRRGGERPLAGINGSVGFSIERDDKLDASGKRALPCGRIQ